MTGTTLRINKENFQDEELPHKLFLTIKQTTKTRNTFANNISIYIKFTKAQISNQILIKRSGRSFGS